MRPRPWQLAAALALVAGAAVALVASWPAGSRAGGGEARTVVVTMHHSRFEPSVVQVEPGERVRFVLRNTDPIDHEFILGDEEVQQIHEEGTESHHGAKPGEVTIPAGEERETTFVFEEPGRLIYGCHLPGHYDYGMKGIVSVT